MYIIELYRTRPFVFSIEVFPPKTEQGILSLQKKLAEFKSFSPDFISVTYGAGGGTRLNTHKIAAYIKNELQIESMAHLTCVNHTPADIRKIIAELLAENIENIMALRGDPPTGDTAFIPQEGGYRYANELIHDLATFGKFCIGAAGYPETHLEAESPEKDRYYLSQKIEAGVNFIITQFFLENEDFFHWRDQLRSEGITVPIVPGILSALSATQIQRFANMNGCKIPSPLLHDLEKYTDSPDSAKEVGLAHAAHQIEDLLKEGVDGIHLYALNRLEIVQQLAPLMPKRSNERKNLIYLFNSVLQSMIS